MTGEISYDVIVCGSGPAGLSAALAASESGRSVLIAERLDRPGVKLLASGGGRCNFTNSLPETAFMDAFGRNGRFMTDALRAGGRGFLLNFLKEHHVEPVLEDGFHYFPAGKSAADVRDAFLNEALRLGARLRTGLGITGITTDENGAVRGVETDRGPLGCGAFILAAGGTAMSALGGTDLGLKLAREAGHAVVRPLPAMAPLVIREQSVGKLAGVSLPDASLAFVSGRRREYARGELVFTHDGFSGPAALNLSAPAYRAFERTGSLEIAFAPAAALDAPGWQAQLQAARGNEPRKRIRTSLARFMPHSLADMLCGECGIMEHTNAMLSNALIDRLSRFLSAVPLHLGGICPMDKAMAMSGGVDLREVDPKTMGSRLVPGLFFAGEILDLAGPCGGFHIQFAVASGRLAGLSAAQSLEKAVSQSILTY